MTDSYTDTDQTDVEKMNEYRELREAVRQLRKNVLELDDRVDTMQWVAAGGRGAVDPRRFERVRASSERICAMLETLVDETPDPYELRDREPDFDEVRDR